MLRLYTVEAEYSNPGDGVHRTRAFATLGAALEYAHWARYCAVFRWSLVRYYKRPVVLWDGGGYEQYYNFSFVPEGA